MIRSCYSQPTAVLDEVLRNDPQGKVACETLVTTGLAFVAGEISTSCYVNIPKVVRNVIKEVGYTNAVYGFDYLTCGVITAIQEQSPDIALGVDKGGAGDQGMVFGYATDETPEFMPLPIILAHKLVRRLAKVRKEKLVDYLRPDGKSQVTIEYDNGRPQRVDTIVISAQHKPGMKLSRLKEDIKELVINKVIPKKFLDKNKPPKILINPTGRFEIGGPQGDTGLTGRKIIVDTYGGVGSHGGGCFSGKDPTKVDRSGSYIARYIAKNIVAAGLAKKCEIQIAYAIGVPEPVSLTVNTYKTGKLHELEINKLIRKNFDLTPQGIIKTLSLREPIYKKTACYGHFGRREFSWEKIDRVESLKRGIK